MLEGSFPVFGMHHALLTHRVEAMNWMPDVVTMGTRERMVKPATIVPVFFCPRMASCLQWVKPSPKAEMRQLCYEISVQRKLRFGRGN